MDDLDDFILFDAIEASAFKYIPIASHQSVYKKA